MKGGAVGCACCACSTLGMHAAHPSFAYLHQGGLQLPPLRQAGYRDAQAATQRWSWEWGAGEVVGGEADRGLHQHVSHLSSPPAQFSPHLGCGQLRHTSALKVSPGLGSSCCGSCLPLPVRPFLIPLSGRCCRTVFVLHGKRDTTSESATCVCGPSLGRVLCTTPAQRHQAGRHKFVLAYLSNAVRQDLFQVDAFGTPHWGLHPQPALG